jgi:hypothetical protein
MSIESYIIKTAFRTTVDGTRIFFPYGVFGKGRIVDSDTTYRKIITHQNIWLFVPLIIVSITIRLSWILFVISTLIMVLINYLTTQRLVKNLAISEVRITWEEIKNNLTKLLAFSTLTNCFLIFAGIIIFLFGAIVILRQLTIKDLTLGIITTTMGIGIIVLAIHSIIQRRAQQDGCSREAG